MANVAELSWNSVCKHIFGLRKSALFRSHAAMVDQQTFADCVAKHIPFLNRIVRCLTRDDSVMEDIVQQTILKALAHSDQFRAESTLKTWLASIAINEVHQAYRCAWRKRSVPLTAENLVSGHDFEPSKASYEVRECEVLVRQAVSRLPNSYRCVAELCELRCLSLKEAAEKLHLTVPAVKTRRHRARNKLRPLLARLKSTS